MLLVPLLDKEGLGAVEKAKTELGLQKKYDEYQHKKHRQKKLRKCLSSI